ncbi:MAG: hypothetical protein JWN62_1360 [Acidimicrobiales bacterium]|jgi:hypothetical protein|nr:hypothetical protein [Acidimicrobiales bacterium]
MSNAEEPTPTAVDPNSEPENIRPSATGLVIADDETTETPEEP